VVAGQVWTLLRLRRPWLTLASPVIKKEPL
jgi:hypothetical protein